MRDSTPRRWFNNTQPQTLQVAVMLLYLNAAFLIFSGLASLQFLVIPIAGQALGAYGIANERKWGYILAVIFAIVPLVLLIRGGGIFGADLLSVLFEVALVALLLHPQSRNYQRIWFK